MKTCLSLLIVFCGMAGHASSKKIGLIYSETGRNAPLGKEQLWGAQLAVDEINKAGGILGQKIELLAKDSQSKNETAVNIAREFITEQAQVLFGGSSYSVSVSLGKFASQAKVPYFAVQTYESRIDKNHAGDFLFRQPADSEMIIRALRAFLSDRLTKSDSFFLLNTDDPWGHHNRKQLGTSFTLGKDNTRGEVSLPWLARPEKIQNAVKQALSKKPSYIILNLYGKDLIAALNQFHKAKNTIPLLTPALLRNHALQVDKGALKNVIAGNSWHHLVGQKFGLERSKKFKKGFEARFKQTPSVPAANAYSIVYGFKQAVESTKSWDRSKVMKALLANRVRILKDEQYFSRDHVAVQSIFVLRGTDSSSNILFEPVALIKANEIVK